MRYYILSAFVALAACDAPLTSTQEAVRGGAQQAFFEDEPRMLFAAIAMNCTDPGNRILRPSPRTIQCEALPSPEAAAGLILEYNGTVENLPRFVYSFNAAPAGGGYVVTADTFARVPQRDGGEQRLRMRDPALEASAREFLFLAGGRPIATK